MMGGHQVGLMRGYYGELQRAVDALERTFSTAARRTTR
jgi:hypothetical protein